MTRDVPRNRHQVNRVQLTMLRPLFRWSAGREAYVLRGIGAKRGPVLIPSEPDSGVDAMFR
jgi:hypothetical protein